MKKWMEKYNIMEKAGAIFAVVLVYGCMQAFGITCPIKYLTGISCPGCGMTRAWIAFLHLDISKALQYHPLFFLPPLFVVTVIFRNKVNKKIYSILIFTFIVLFVTIYLLRMRSGNNNIVVFSPRDGLIFRLFSLLFT